MNFLKRIKVEKAFILIALIFGCMIAIITPPFQVPDEGAHFLRSFQISKGEVFEIKINNNIGGYFPNSIIDFMNNINPGLATHPEKKQSIESIKIYLHQPLKSDANSFKNINTPYFPIVYLPQSIGMTIGKILNLSPMLLLYLGRLFNLIAWSLLIYFAIKITPIGKKLFLILALTPMSLFQASSLSADAVTNGIAFLLVSLILYYTLNENIILDRKKIGLIFLLVILISLAKQAYIVFSLLFLFIFLKKNINKRKLAFQFILLLILQLTFYGIWTVMLNNSTLANTELVTRIHERLSFMINYPFYSINILINTIMTNFKIYLQGFIGDFGWLDAPLPNSFIAFYASIIFIVSLLDNNNNIRLKAIHRIILFLTSFITIVCIFTLLFLTYNGAGSKIIEGVQGRYFIPIAPLIFLAFYNNIFKIKENKLFVSVVIISIFALSLTIKVLLFRYFAI